MTLPLGPIDIAVLGAYLAAAIGIGLKVGGKTKSLESYLLGDRDLAWWAILGSIVATETSAATVLSVPGEAYGATGMKFLQLALGYIVGRAIIVRLLLPLYFRGQLLTAYEVLQQRFGGATRQAASFVFLVTRNLGDGLRLFLAAIVLHRLAEVPMAWSVLIMGVISTAYTFWGGMRSIVWNDCVQFVVYMVGAIAAVFVIAGHISGGWSELFRFAAEHDKFRVLDFNPAFNQDYTLWAGVIGGAVLTIGTHGTDHSMVQRYLSARSQSAAGWAVFLSGIVVFLQFTLFLFIGIELACYYAQNPGPVLKKDEVFADFIVHVFPQNTGLIGLMLAAILSSTLSSSLSASAAALVNDFYLPCRKSLPTSEHLYFVTRGLTIAFGVVQVAIGIGAQFLNDSVVKNALTIAGFSAGLLLGVFALGVLTRRAGQTSALVGGAAGLVVLLAVKFVLPGQGVAIAFPWLALIGASTTFGVGCFVSLFVPQQTPPGATS